MKRIYSFAVFSLALLLAVPAMAQKFAWVHSQRVLSEYQEYVDAQNKLNTIRSEYEAEYQKMVTEYQNLLNEIDSQSLLLSPEKKQETPLLALYCTPCPNMILQIASSKN